MAESPRWSAWPSCQHPVTPAAPDCRGSGSRSGGMGSFGRFDGRVEVFAEADADARLVVGVVPRGGRNVAVPQESARGVDAVLGRNQRADFLAQFVQWLVGFDAFAPQPLDPAVEHRLAAPVGVPGGV